MFKFLLVSEPTCTHIHFIHTHLSFLHHFFELFITFFQQSHSLQIHPNLTSCSITPTHKDKIHPRYTSRYTHLTDRHTYEIIKFGLLPISDRHTDTHTYQSLFRFCLFLFHFSRLPICLACLPGIELPGWFSFGAPFFGG